MKIEIVDFYALRTKNKDFRGTLHIYLPESKQDIRGIDVFQKKGFVFLQMPYKVGMDPESKKRVKYPVVSWMDETLKEFMSRLREVALPWLEPKLKDWKPLLFEKPIKKFDKKKHNNRNTDSHTDKGKYSTKHASNVHSSPKTFSDPPKRTFDRSASRSPGAYR